MSQEIRKTPGIFLAGFVGAALSSAWLAARPTEYISAVCLGTAACALLSIAQTLIFSGSGSPDDENASIMSRHASQMSAGAD